MMVVVVIALKRSPVLRFSKYTSLVISVVISKFCKKIKILMNISIIYCTFIEI